MPEYPNHWGNVMAVISDKASDTNEPTVVSLSDYYPYGMTELGRSWNAGAEGYRYGFNTQENVPELGEGHTTALYWEYDGRLGRRWNLDLITKEYESNYSVFGNSPIYAIDVDGADSTLFDDYGLELCRISNDNGATNVWFKVRTTDLTEQMYGNVKYKNDTLMGWSNPITKEEQESAVRSAKDYRDEKLLFGIYKPLTLKSLEQNIKWNAFVEILNQIYANVSFEHLNDMESQYPDGNREFGWDMARRNGGNRYILDDPTVGPKMDPNTSESVSVDCRRNHSHPVGWIQPPSSVDIINTKLMAKNSTIKTRYVWAMGYQMIYVIDENGVVAEVPFGFYLKNSNEHD